MDLERTVEAGKRAVWQRPALHRMDAADAEAGIDPSAPDVMQAMMQQSGGGS